MNDTVLRDREPWAAELSALADLDLRLGSGSGAVVVLDTPEPDRSALLAAFHRLAVHSQGRAERTDDGHWTCPWRRAVRALLQAVPQRREIACVLEMLDPPPASGPPLSDIADAIVLATHVHPFTIVIDELPPDDHRSWELAAMLARYPRPHGALVVIGHPGTTPNLAALGGRWIEIGGRREAGVDTGLAVDLPADNEELLAIAIWERPVTVALLARFLDRPWVTVAGAVDDLLAAGLVERSGRLPGAVVLADRVDARSVIDPAPVERRQELHLRIAHILMDEADGARLLADTVSAAQHALAAGSDMDLIVRTAMTAAAECAASGRLRRAAAILASARDAGPPRHDRARILAALGHLSGRMGLSHEATLLFDAAHATAQETDDIELIADVAAKEALVARQTQGSGFEERRVRRVLERLGPRRPDLRAVLELRLADLNRLTDPAACHALIDSALENARVGHNPDVEALALRLASLLSTDHAHAKDLDQIIDTLDALPGSLAEIASFVPRVSLCLQSGDRRELDDLTMRYRVALREHPMALWDADVETLRAVQAMHDVDRAGLLDAIETMRQCGRLHGALGGYWMYPLALLWSFHTGETIDVADPDLPVPTQGGVLDLFRFAGLLVATELGNAHALDLLAESVPAVDEVPIGEWTSPSWWPFIARAAWRVQDREKAVAAVNRVRPIVDQWVLVGRFVPIGPVGWFAAETQSWLGDRVGAIASADAGLAAARRMRSHAWVARCSLQRARLAHADGDDDTARSLLDAAERLVEVHGLTPCQAECDALRSTFHSPLGGPEAEVLRLVADGLSNKQIAVHLGIGVKRVERLLSSAFRRLGVHNRAEAVAVLLKAEGRG